MLFILRGNRSSPCLPLSCFPHQGRRHDPVLFSRSADHVHSWGLICCLASRSGLCCLLRSDSRLIDYWARRLLAGLSAYVLYLPRLRVAIMSFPGTSCSPACLACNKQGQWSLLSSLPPPKQCYFRSFTFLVAICVKRPVATELLILALLGKASWRREDTGSSVKDVTLNSAQLGVISELWLSRVQRARCQVSPPQTCAELQRTSHSPQPHSASPISSTLQSVLSR